MSRSPTRARPSREHVSREVHAADDPAGRPLHAAERRPAEEARALEEPAVVPDQALDERLGIVRAAPDHLPLELPGGPDNRGRLGGRRGAGRLPRHPEHGQRERGQHTTAGRTPDMAKP